MWQLFLEVLQLSRYSQKKKKKICWKQSYDFPKSLTLVFNFLITKEAETWIFKYARLSSVIQTLDLMRHNNVHCHSKKPILMWYINKNTYRCHFSEWIHMVTTFCLSFNANLPLCLDQIVNTKLLDSIRTECHLFPSKSTVFWKFFPSKYASGIVMNTPHYLKFWFVSSLRRPGRP